ncbi:thymocyte nuclear protein 1 isoform X2 [Dendrobates tinctorius]|uniref:thymocyte nuclear protein 1 isoform X2 n=1 Tax=Dendrobates tinctorius TaxID=92724 RepID=UPI003CC9905D
MHRSKRKRAASPAAGQSAVGSVTLAWVLPPVRMTHKADARERHWRLQTSDSVLYTYCFSYEKDERHLGGNLRAKKVVRTQKKVAGPSTSADSRKAEYHCWLMKSEPESRMEKGMDMKARNFLRAMKIGQEAFFYHSNCKEPGIAGIVKVVKEAHPDHTQFDPKNPHYDAASDKNNPRWCMVDVQFVRMLRRYISLAELKTLHQKHKMDGGPLRAVALFTQARLSVQPLTQEEFDFILSLEKKTPEQKSD